jgi:hydrogenase/urease accessory protein HupE
LLPIAHSHDVGTLFKSAFESGITAAVSIFTIKLSLYLTNLVTDTVLGVLTNLLPFEVPEPLQQLISSVINFGAEVFFVAVLLGYAWSRTRQQFMRL